MVVLHLETGDINGWGQDTCVEQSKRIPGFKIVTK